MTATTAPRKPRSESRQRPVVASARLSGQEWDQLRARATADGRSVSEYLRALVQRDISPA